MYVRPNLNNSTAKIRTDAPKWHLLIFIASTFLPIINRSVNRPLNTCLYLINGRRATAS